VSKPQSFWDRIPPDGRQRLHTAWERIKGETVGSLVDKAKFYAEAVSYGADPIEAMHGHLCGPHCMHWEAMGAAQKARLKKAPWNRGEK